MDTFQRMSRLYAPTIKEDPTDAEIASHRLLLRGAFIRKTAAGVYTFMPLGFAVLQKIEQIVREEMNAIGSQEIMMPALQPAELWHESGRWNDYGPELMRLSDRHEHDFCLGPTHEELITALVRNELRSYRELPKSLYQIQVKFRDEIRPRFGLLRSREFIMKDAYSFHATRESLQEHYDEMLEAYRHVCRRCGIDFREVDADPGQIGGKVSIEFMALADAGEAELVYCDCGFASDVEVAEGGIAVREYPAERMEKVSTPGVHTIADLAAFLGIGEDQTVKALVGLDGEGRAFALFLPGDHEACETKIEHVVPGFHLADDEEIEKLGLPKGSIGPVGLPEGVTVIGDRSLQDVHRWVVGANDDGYHFTGAALGEDFAVDRWADIATVKPGDTCPECGKPLSSVRGIEVAQVFQLGDKYSRSMNATYADENGEDQHFYMGCYGIGVSRTLAAIVEQSNDENGIVWPVSVAPAEVIVLPLSADDTVMPVAERIAEALDGSGIEVVIDDRDERAGVKFADADLIGWPYQVICGKRGIKDGTVEVKDRATGQRENVAIDEVVDHVADLVFAAHAALGNLFEE